MSASTGLVRRQVDVPPGCCLDGEAGAGGELWFVVSGAGVLSSGTPAEADLSMRPDRGIWIPPAEAYRARAEGSGLGLDIVALPADTTPGPGRTLTSDFAGCAVETTGDRQFRVLFGPGTGFAAATQFVGEIPPGRAPEHSHPYDETVLVLEGTGRAHVAGASQPLAPGTSLHLSPGTPHCLENTGSSVLRVLGVFHPADSPAAKLSSAAAPPA